MNSLDFLAMFNARESSTAVITLITIESPELASPIRLARNKEDVTSRGDTFTGWPFGVALPGEGEDRLLTVTLTMAAIYDPDAPMTGGPVGVINTITTGTLLIEWVLHTAPDTVEAEYELTIQQSTFNSQVVSVTLGYEDMLNAQATDYNMSPLYTPGVHAG